MKPVFQTMFAGNSTDPDTAGNCMQAAFASILDLSLDDVPHFILEGEEIGSTPDRPGWWRSIEMFTARQGFRMVVCQQPLGECLGLMSGKSPRGNWEHIVVAEGGVMVHDPHPSGDGVLDPYEWWYLVPVDPAIHKRFTGAMVTSEELIDRMNHGLDNWNLLNPHDPVMDRLES